MRKIPPSLDNPIDNFFIYLSEISAPFYKNLNFTANTLTTLSLFFGIMACVAFYYSNYKLSALLILISYYFDCADGFYARKYNMTSKFGDMYDHFSDYFKTGLILLLMFVANKGKFLKIYLPILVVFFILMMVQMGCQEKLKIQDEHGDMLNHAKMFCPGNQPEKIMQYSRYFGSGTTQLILAIFIFTFDY